MAGPISPFLEAGPRTRPDSLAIVQLSRDQFQPIYLRDTDGEVDGYAEGAVLNTRFGSFPHSTLLHVPWGSQIRASVVDTGSRGRKRKRNDRGGTATGETAEAATEGGATEAGAASERKRAKETVTAASGFIHILPPTPEIWTMSLPHRTQVVYTSDYSYILHRLHARPGSRIIEAGSGSGSFTHASARAVYDGSSSNSSGAVFSYEFHNERYQTMKAELESHQLAGLVTLTNRDVYEHGFLLDNGESPLADTVFLDLPAPWRALTHLSRRRLRRPAAAAAAAKETGAGDTDSNTDAPNEWLSPLNPKKSVHICTFSPCIEQVTRTVSTMRQLGWVDIEMVEIANKKIIVYREKPDSGSSSKGSGPVPRNVLDAVARLKAIDTRTREYNKQFWQARTAEGEGEEGSKMTMEADSSEKPGEAEQNNGNNNKKRIHSSSSAAPQWPFLEGVLTSRVEPEMKTHTSYLVFAVLPREWTEADEAAAAARWPCGNEQGVIGAVRRELRKEQKRQQIQQADKRQEEEQ